MMRFRQMVLPGLIAGALVTLRPGGLSAQNTNLYWGDTHLHTSYSSDAYNWGNVNADPDTAYRFARGLPVIHPTLGSRVRRKQPLDFLAVTDHAEGFGLGANLTPEGTPAPTAAARGGAQAPAAGGARGGARGAGQAAARGARGAGQAAARGPRGAGQAAARGARGAGQAAAGAARGAAPAARGGARGGGRGDAAAQTARLQAAWPLYVDAAEKNNEPGVFTTFVGWEFTSMQNGNNHRVVFTSADGARAKQFLPFSTRDSNRPEDLWNWLDQTSARLGIEFVAIPHNSNISNGHMFDAVDSDGRPFTAEYARARIRWEPLVEISQIKGTSETHPMLSPNDEFANFEIYQALLNGGISQPTPADYVRTALLRGLQLEATLGVNPFKIGIEAATDSHTGLSSAEEDNFFGKSVIDSTPAAGPVRMMNLWEADGWDFSAGGSTGVWATANTREAILAAFKRKEVYGTSGTRIALRVFGGYGYETRDAEARNLPEAGYKGGVPMGGDLKAAPNGKRVTLLIQAVKDPTGANLDRVQVIKGWLDEKGETHERVYDAVWSGNRKKGADGKLPPVGSTVDLKKGAYTNTIGSAQLTTVWTDPDFNPRERAFYYVRTLEIPTPRHNTYDALALGMDPATAHARPATLQERAFSSPIWYTP
ncbi:MAG TPA: DUF3604 domain-containing protein [Terriglobia bacterium]|nr:DUF3604 domain-containing protein [Terriglobia bacterium]